MCGLFVVLVAAGAFAASALAYYSGSIADGNAHAAVGTLRSPKSLTAAPGAGKVDLSWTSVIAPADGPVSYYVSRDGAPVGGSCGAPSSPIGGTSCTDSGLARGSYSYTVTAVWRSWTATGPPATPVTLTSGAASRIVLSGSTDDLPSGSTRELTATVEDSVGNTVSSGADSGIAISFQQADGSGSVSGTGSATASAGVASATVTGVIAGDVDVTATGTFSGLGQATSNTLGFTVTPGPADAAESTLMPVTSFIAADGTATQVLTVQAKDVNGNDETVGGGAVTIAQASGTGTIGPVADNGNGTYTATVTAPPMIGSGVFVATLDGSPVESGTASQTQATVDYVAGPAVGIVLSDEATRPSPDVSCSGSVGSIVCSSYDEGNGEEAAKVLTAAFMLVDQFGQPVTNTGPSIDIDLSASGWGEVDPSGAAALTIPTGASTTSASFTAARHDGNNKTLTVTATVHGTGETLTIVLSSDASPPAGKARGLPFVPDGETSSEKCQCNRFASSSPRTTSRSSTSSRSCSSRTRASAWLVGRATDGTQWCSPNRLRRTPW